MAACSVWESERRPESSGIVRSQVGASECLSRSAPSRLRSRCKRSAQTAGSSTDQLVVADRPRRSSVGCMDIRRFYVVSIRDERGPFSIEELAEELDAGRITATQQVRTGMGTMLGSVREVIETPKTM